MAIAVPNILWRLVATMSQLSVFGAQERGVGAVGMIVAHRINDETEICET